MMGPCLPFWFLLAPAFFYSIPEFQPSLFYNKLFPTSGLLHVFLSLTHLGNSTHFGGWGGGNGWLLLNGYRVSVFQDEKSYGMYGSDG